MKFLLDQSADFRLISHLRGGGHDVRVVSQDYPSGLPDDDVLTIARNEHRVLLVADYDFGELIFRDRLPHAGVILFRLPGASLPLKISRLDAVLAEHAAALEHGEFVVVTPGQIRVAGHPRPR